MPGNYTCCVRTCEVTGKNTVPLFRLPTCDVPRLEKFLQFIDRPELSAREPHQLKHYLICALHFEAKYISRTQCRTQLSRSAIPTIIDVKDSPLWPVSPLVTLRRRKKRRPREEIEREKKIKKMIKNRTLIKPSGLALTKKILKRNAVPSVFSWAEDTKDNDEWETGEEEWVRETPSDVEGEEGQTYAMVVEMDADDREAGQGSDEERSGSSEIIVYEYEYDGDSLKPVLRGISSDESANKEPSQLRIKREKETQGGNKSKADVISDRILTSEQRDVVIERLNSIRNDEQVRMRLGAKLTASIEDYITEHGNFIKLDQLLRVRHVGPKTIRNLCDKLLGIDEASPKSRSREPSPGRRTRSPSQVILPPLPEEVCAAVKLLVTVVVDLASVSWALVDAKKKILVDWKTILLEDTFTLKDVVVKAALIERELPAADLCILEDPTLGSHSSRSSQMLKSHLSCALATSLHIKREDVTSTGPVTRVAFVKNRLVEKHFNASVGSETISLQPFIADIVEQKVTVGRSNVFISQDLLGYFKCVEAPSREQLSRAGLLAVTCVDLVLNRGRPVPAIKEEIIYESS